MQKVEKRWNELEASEVDMQKVTIYPVYKLKEETEKDTPRKKLMHYTEQNSRNMEMEMEEKLVICVRRAETLIQFLSLR